MSSPCVSGLPDAILRQVASFLDAPDVLQLLTCNRQLHQLGTNASFWTGLFHGYSCRTPDETCNTPSIPGVSDNEQGPFDRALILPAKRHYLQDAYCRRLPFVRWQSLHTTGASPSQREGHLAFSLSTAQDVRAEDLLVVTGGFTEDPAVYVKVVRDAGDNLHEDWQSIFPSGASVGHLYGVTLTALDATRAVQFGGFRSAGYANESDQVAVLTVDYATRTAHWTLPETHHGDIHPGNLARAYHTATLLSGRYLLVVGGMKSTESTLCPVLLDTVTWSWHEVTTVGKRAPSARYGHSTVFDENKSRCVIFGGGSGTDLLRTGQDNAQVWELKLPQGWQSDILESFPWTWRLIHDEPAGRANETDPHVGDMNVQDDEKPVLSPVETLVLGRCHMAHRVSPKSVLLAFGSGRPSTDGVLTYDLETDHFSRPQVVGVMPIGRLSFASVFLKKQGYVFIHGGYSTQSGGARADMHLLDLAPALATRLGRAFHIYAHSSDNAAVVDNVAMAEAARFYYRQSWYRTTADDGRVYVAVDELVFVKRHAMARMRAGDADEEYDSAEEEDEDDEDD